jgi:hypothetical protein
MRDTLPQLILPVVFFIALAVGLGQYRRVTNDVSHDIDRFGKTLSALRRLELQDIRFVEPFGHAESLPQARLVMAPTVLYADDEPRVDTTLYVVFPADSAQIPTQHILWTARDDAYLYALVSP